MAFDENTVNDVVAMAKQGGAPEGVANQLHADLMEALHHYHRRMERINRHSEVLLKVQECGYNVTHAANELEMTREGVYKHLRKSTENSIGVDTKAA